MTERSFSPRTEALLAHAAALCAASDVRLTELRRHVLGLILDAAAPVGAYDLLESLRATRARAAPPTVYRALDFLREHGLIHRLERLSAFVGCVSHADGGKLDAHAAQFLICRNCGRVTELDDHDLAHALADAARRQGFVLAGATVEAEGLCLDCAGGGPAAPLSPRSPA